jgi:hypothetical protein
MAFLSALSQAAPKAFLVRPCVDQKNEIREGAEGRGERGEGGGEEGGGRGGGEDGREGGEGGRMGGLERENSIR